MGLSSPFAGPGRPRKLLFLSALLAANMGSAGCGPGRQVALPPPRPIVVTSGERLRVDAARMDSVYEWLVAENLNIQEDPTFMIRGVPTARETLPWLTMTIEGDTARIQYDRAHPDITTAFNVYAHLHLMKNVGRLDEWLPDHAGDEGFELERAIVARMADAWLLGRAVFDVPAYGPLDELVYAKGGGLPGPFPAGSARRRVRPGAGGLGAGQTGRARHLPHLVSEGFRPRASRASRDDRRSAPVGQAGPISQRAVTGGPSPSGFT